MESQNLPLSLLSNPNCDQDRRRSNAALTAHVDVRGAQKHERVVPLKWTLGLGLNLPVEVFSQPRDGRLRKSPSTGPSGDLFDPARRDALKRFLHQGKNQGLLRSLITVEQLGREAPVLGAGNFQLKGAYSRSQLPLVAALPVPSPLLALVPVGSETEGHLCLKHLTRAASP